MSTTPAHDALSAAPSSSLYDGKTMLAPMVRVCSLGFRLLCADNGADVVFTEEVVAAKLRQCRREIRRYPARPFSGKDAASAAWEEVAEYALYEPFKKAFKRAVVLAVHARSGREAATPDHRHAPVVLQLGACDGDVAADAAALCCEDISGIDLNMGCPKKFSINNGFGAALMVNTAAAGAILRSIHARVNSSEALAARGGRAIPISFKTRLMDREDAAATVDMLEAVAAAAGHSPATPVIHAVTLHARVREQRSEEPPLLEVASEVVRRCRAGGPASLLANTCFVLNGSVTTRADGAAKCAALGFDACMIARAALWDPVYVFQRTPHASKPDERDEAHFMASLRALLLYSVQYRSEFKNFKYHLTRAFPEVACIKYRMPVVQERLRSYEDCFDFFGLDEATRAACRGWAHDVELVDTVPDPVPAPGEGGDDDAVAAKRQRTEAAPQL